MKLDLLTNATVVDDAIRFVSQNSKDKEELKSSSNDRNQDYKESKEPDYGEDKDQLEEEQEERLDDVINEVQDIMAEYGRLYKIIIEDLQNPATPKIIKDYLRDLESRCNIINGNSIPRQTPYGQGLE
jgi:hypothetical protein